ncbi:LysR family transcriptional regulator [Herbiconiux ginsengi]|uniref:Transcriptional regulator, LysR family n=1 Tax=Herbiconiux ginsengi TaxID=381665 RepID=A0A1H3TVL8_9MICO|nr:LysR family transcriptional regulator [Herbiconiux ginsengi]SDZ54098.1 transcriptional regulator, LysR family [Herbiconiux ginsengi]
MSEPDHATAGKAFRAPTPFSLRQLEYFVAIAETGSIAGASIATHASGSAVSEAISSLEQSLGATLLVRRRSKGATLTSDGRVILRIAYRLLAEAELITGSVGDRKFSLAGPVRIGFTGTLANHILPDLVVEVQAQHPNIAIEHVIGDMPTLLEAHDAAELDLIVTYDLDFIPEFSKRKLMAAEMMVLLPRDHPLAKEPTISLEALASHPMVLLDITASRLHTFELMRGRGVTPLIAYRTDDRELHRSLIQRGLGYGIQLNLDQLPLPSELHGVVYLPITPPTPTLGVLVAWRSNPLPPRVEAVVGIMQSIAAPS